jgi:phosphatidylserine decarboxylase
MTVRTLFTWFAQQPTVNFLATNLISRYFITRFMGWFSRIEQPLVRDLSIGLWKRISDLDLTDAKTIQFRSLHDCFTRELKDGARIVDTDPAIVVSPCDAIVGACGRVEGTRLFQAKGQPYSLAELLGDAALVNIYRNGQYVTLRLTPAMYHRFHAPHDCRVEQVTYISGDTWNVNPAALARVDRLFCRNERALIRARLKLTGHLITLVPVAAVLVASIRLKFLDVLLHLKYRGPNIVHCDAHVGKGEELGWFEHGSTILVFAPDGYELCADVMPGALIRMGQPLLRLPGKSIAARLLQTLAPGTG